jgi:hypothetical protein
MSSLKNCCLAQSPSIRPIRIIIAVALIAWVLIVSFKNKQQYNSKREDMSIQKIKYKNPRYLSLLDLGGEFMQLTKWTLIIVGLILSEAATFIKIDSSGNLEWQKIKF